MEEKHMKRPWYIWLSLIGFFGLNFVMIRKIYRNFDLWTRFVGKNVVLFLGILMIPAGVLSSIMDSIQGKSVAITNLLDIIVLLYIYVAGVIITAKLDKWNKLNLNT